MIFRARRMYLNPERHLHLYYKKWCNTLAHTGRQFSGCCLCLEGFAAITKYVCYSYVSGEKLDPIYVDVTWRMLAKGDLAQEQCPNVPTI